MKDIKYRWAITTNNVYAFTLLHGNGFHDLTLARYKNEVSGIVLKSNLPKLVKALIPFGYSFKDKNIKLLKADTYMKHWDRYNK